MIHVPDHCRPTVALVLHDLFRNMRDMAQTALAGVHEHELYMQGISVGYGAAADLVADAITHVGRPRMGHLTASKSTS